MWDEESEAIHRFKLETVKSLSRLMKEPLKHLAHKKNQKKNLWIHVHECQNAINSYSSIFLDLLYAEHKWLFPSVY